MAFNPFSIFRKNQKVLFAVLTIVCMIVFILQFGRGDIFERLIGRAGGGQGEKVVTLYGRDVTTGDLEQVRQARQTANELITTALAEGEKQASKELQEYKPEKPDDVDKEITGIHQAYSQRSFQPQILQFQFQNRMITSEQFDRQLRALKVTVPPEIRQSYQRLAEVAKGVPADKAEQRKMLADLRLLLRNQYYEFTRGDVPFYFGGGVNTPDLLDFLIWKEQARRLGVVLTKADARRALAHEAADHDLPQNPGGPWKDDAAFKEYFGAHQQMSEDQAVAALVDEFRVRIAKDLMDGPVSGVASLDDADRQPPSPASPYDFWTFYRDNRTTIKAAFLPLAVQSYLGNVTGAPSEQELKELFADYRSVEPKPDSATPGFKEPRRIKVAYLTADAGSDYYKARGLGATVDPAVYYVGSAFGAGAAPGGVAPAAVLAAVANEDPLARDYEAKQAGGSSWLASSGAVYPYDVHDTNYLRPDVIAGAVGQLFAGSMNPQGSGLAAGAAYTGAAESHEASDRARVLSATFLQGAGWSTAGSAFAGFALQAPLLPPLPPAPLVYRQVLEQHQKDVLHDKPDLFGQPPTPGIVSRNLREFGDEVEKMKGKPDAEIAAFIRKTAKERGWELHENAGLDDRYTLEDDPALKEAKDALEMFLRMHAQNPAEGPPSFAKELFDLFPAGKYQPSLPISEGADKYVVFWRAEDEHARELGYDEARPRVLAAWRLQEARKLALIDAQRINEAARTQASPVEAVKYLRDQKLGADQKPGEVFELPEGTRMGIARLVPSPTFNAGVISLYSRYTVPADRIPFAPADLVDRLLSLDKPGDTLIFKDKPATHFYVAVLEERPNLEFKDRDKDTGFLDAFRDASQPQKGQLWQQFFLPERQKKYQTALMRRLREEAGPVNDQGQLVVSAKQQQQQPAQPAEPPPEGDQGNDFGS